MPLSQQYLAGLLHLPRGSSTLTATTLNLHESLQYKALFEKQPDDNDDGNMSSNPSRSILILGLAMSRSGGPYTAEQIKSMVEKEMAKAEAAGHHVEQALLEPETPLMEQLEQAQHAMKSRHWDVISIGFGVRGDRSLTPLFEGLVNTALREIQPAPRMSFSVTPDSIFDNIANVMKDS